MSTKTKEINQVTEVELTEGQVCLASIRQSSTESKAMIEFAEIIRNENAGPNVLALLNASDDRFNNTSSVRRAWLSVEKADAAKQFGIDPKVMDALAKNNGAVIELKIMNPAIVDAKGTKHALAIQLNDTTDATEYQSENAETQAKQIPGNENKPTKYFTKNGKLIFNNPTIVAKSARKHVIIETTPEERLTWSEFQALQSATSVSYAETVAKASKAPEAING